MKFLHLRVPATCAKGDTSGTSGTKLQLAITQKENVTIP